MILDLLYKNNKTCIHMVVDSDEEVSEVFIDDYSNWKNYISRNSYDHSYVFSASDIFVKSTPMTTTYGIFSEKMNKKNISGIYVITLLYVSGKIESRILYDFNELYCVKMGFIENSCNTCLDNSSERMLTILMFREMLLRNAASLHRIEDAMHYYTDIFRPFCSTRIVDQRPFSAKGGGGCNTGFCKI